MRHGKRAHLIRKIVNAGQLWIRAVRHKGIVEPDDRKPRQVAPGVAQRFDRAGRQDVVRRYDAIKVQAALQRLLHDLPGMRDAIIVFRHFRFLGEIFHPQQEVGVRIAAGAAERIHISIIFLVTAERPGVVQIQRPAISLLKQHAYDIPNCSVFVRVYAIHVMRFQKTVYNQNRNLRRRSDE